MSLSDQVEPTPSNVMPLPSARPPTDSVMPVCDLRELLKNARNLILYAGDEGIEVEPDILETIISAGKPEATSQEAVKAIRSIDALAAKVRAEAHRTINRYFWVASILGLILIFMTVSSFISDSYSKNISDNIALANQYALDLNAGHVEELSTKQGDLIKDVATLSALQKFVATTREINSTSLQLQPFVFWSPIEDRAQKGALELKPPVTYKQIADQTQNYQAVRSSAKQLQNSQSAIYAAVANGILPLLYAILGALAYLLKTFSEEVKARTFRPSGDTDKARLLIAAIGGGVIGLFSSVVSQGTSLSLLAVAFLVG